MFKMLKFDTQYKLFFSQQTMNFQQIHINLYFQGQHLTGLTANQFVIDNNKDFHLQRLLYATTKALQHVKLMVQDYQKQKQQKLKLPKAIPRQRQV